MASKASIELTMLLPRGTDCQACLERLHEVTQARADKLLDPNAERATILAGSR